MANKKRRLVDPATLEVDAKTGYSEAAVNRYIAEQKEREAQPDGDPPDGDRPAVKKKRKQSPQVWVNAQIAQLTGNIVAAYQVEPLDALQMIMTSVLVGVCYHGETRGGQEMFIQLEKEALRLEKQEERDAKAARREQRKNEKILSAALRVVK